MTITRRSIRRIASLLVLVVAGAVLTAGVPVVKAAGGTYVDKNHGFAIRLLKGWTQTPTQPGRSLEIAKFKDDRKGEFAELSIYRFQVAGSAVTTPDTGDGAEAEEGEEDEPENPFAAMMPQSALEKLESDHEGTCKWLARLAKANNYKIDIPAFPKPKKAKFKKAKLEGQIYIIEFTTKAKYRIKDSYSVNGVVSNGTEEYLISYECPPNQARKSRGPFISSILSFEFQTDKKMKEMDPEKRGKVINKNDLELLDPEKRERIKEQLVGTWKYFDTPHYIVVYNCDYRLARYIADRCEYMRVNAFEKVFPPPYPIKECGVIRVCKAFDEYYHYGGPKGSAGYWSSGTDELVFPDLSRSKKEDPTTIGVLQHEGFHQYVHYALAGNAPPIWFNEGFAEYFFCVSMKSRGKRLIFEPKHQMRYGVIKSALGSNKITPIKRFIWLSQGEHYRQSSLHYAEGWAFCTWLMHHTRNERYRQIPKILFEEMQKAFVEQKEKEKENGLDLEGLLRRGRGPKGNPILKAATEKAFEGIDLDQLEKDFKIGFKRKM